MVALIGVEPVSIHGGMEHPVPLAMGRPCAGFCGPGPRPGRLPLPGPGRFRRWRTDLDEVLTRDVTSTFILRVTGDPLEGVGTYHGDEVPRDRSLTPQHGNVVLAALDGDFTVKALHLYPDRVVL